MRKIILTVLMLFSVAGMALAQDAPAQDYCASALECDDGKECTIDYCGTTVNMLESGMMEITAGYCQSVNVADGTKCSIGKCYSGVCVKQRTANANVRKTAAPAVSEQSMETENGLDSSVPEFSTVAAGLAFAGAGMGYIFLRRKK